MATAGRSAALLLISFAGVPGLASAITREEALRFGSFEVVPGQPGIKGVLLGAPHGTGDTNTGEIVRLLARDIGIAAVIAWGFTRRQTGDLRINVNRPTEGAGLTPSQERWTTRAGVVWEEYRRLMLESAGGRVGLYIEFHCNDVRETGGAIEIGTQGVSRGEAVRMKDAYYRIRNQVIAEGSVPRIELKIHPVDKLVMGSGAAKMHGSLALPRRAFAIELPVSMTTLMLERRPYREVFATLLREVIAQPS